MSMSSDDGVPILCVSHCPALVLCYGGAEKVSLEAPKPFLLLLFILPRRLAVHALSGVVGFVSSFLASDCMGLNSC
jgi:hypothetical protein